MRILSLNVWGARINPEILCFIAKYGDFADAFCLQEMMRDTGETEFDPQVDAHEIRKTVETFAELLPEFEYRFSNFYGNDYGLCTFVRKSIGIASHSEHFVHGNDPRARLESGNVGAHCRKILVTDLGNGIRLVNFHGLWIGGYGKKDHADRLIQSDRILEILHPFCIPTILVGDFNLDPDTESLARLERAGFRNLVREYGIVSTRTSLYTKRDVSPFADYALVTPDVAIEGFWVLPDEVSDHAPLLLNVSVSGHVE